MTKKIVGVFATVALLTSGTALAGGTKIYPQENSPQLQGQRQQTGSSASGISSAHASKHASASSDPMLGEKQISGTVLKSSGSELKLRTESGVILVKVDKNTQFQDANVKKIKDIKEGQQVRTSFTVEKDANLAKSVSMDSAMGGSGLESDPGINQDMGQDTGGSGLSHPNDTSHDLGGKNDVGGAGNLSDSPDMGSKTY